MEPFLRRLDRIAGGRYAGYTVPAAGREHPRTRRAFAVIGWLLAAELLLGAVAVAVAVALDLNGVSVPFAVWMRSLVVLGMTLTLFYFGWRARKGYYWAYLRLRLFSKIFPIVTLVIAAIPGLYPFWMVSEQIVFSLILIGVADYLDTDHMRSAFPKPARPAATVPSPSRRRGNRGRSESPGAGAAILRAARQRDALGDLSGDAHPLQ